MEKIGESQYLEDLNNSVKEYLDSHGKDISDADLIRENLRLLNDAKTPGDLYFHTLEFARIAINVPDRESITSALNDLNVYAFSQLDDETRSSCLAAFDAKSYLTKNGIKDTELRDDLDTYIAIKMEATRTGSNLSMDFPTQGMSFPFSTRLRDTFISSQSGEEGSKSEVTEYAFLRAKHASPKPRLDPEGKDQKMCKMYREALDGYLAIVASYLSEVANMNFEAGNINENFGKYLSRVIVLFEYLRAVNINSNLKINIPLIRARQETTEHSQFYNESLGLTKFLGKEASFIASEEMLLFHLFKGLNKVVGHPERNPKSADDRLMTVNEVKESLDKESPDFNIFNNFITWIEKGGENFLDDESLKNEQIRKSLVFSVDLIEKELAKSPKNPYLLDERFKRAVEAYLKEAKSYLEDFSTYNPNTAFANNIFVFSYLYIDGNASDRDRLTEQVSGDYGFYFYGEKTPSGSGQSVVAEHLNHLVVSLYEIDLPQNFVQFDQLFSIFFILYLMREQGILKGFDQKFINQIPINLASKEFINDIQSEIQQVQGSIYVNESLLFYKILKSWVAYFINSGLLQEDARNLDLSNEDNRRKITNIFMNLLESKFQPAQLRLVRPFLKNLCFKANQVLRDAAPKPEPCEPVKSETVTESVVQVATPNVLPMTAGDLGKLRQFAQAHFPSKGGRSEKVHNKQLQREIDEARVACENKACILPEPMSANVNLEGKNYSNAIKSLHIERKVGAAGDKASNLICGGSVGIVSGKNILQFEFRMDEKGDLRIILGGTEVKQSEFASGPMQNFYRELQKIILSELKDRLVRVATGNEQLRLAGNGSSPKERHESEVASAEVIAQRTMDSMFVVENDDDEPVVHIGALIPKGTSQIDALLSGDSEIRPENVADIVIYQEEVRDVEGEELKVYVPIHADLVATVLEEVRTGKLSGDHVFLMKQRGVIKRLGYQPWSKSGEPDTRNITQRVGNDSRQEALRKHLFDRGVGSLTVESGLQFYLSKTPADVKKLRILTRNEVGGLDSTLLLTDDVALMKGGAKFEDGLSDGAVLIDQSKGIHAEEVVSASGETGYKVAVVLNIPQKIHYVQGSFASLTKARACLKR